MKRKGNGYYETADGRFAVERLVGALGSADGWVWRPIDDVANDIYATKRHAVEDLNAWIAEGH